MRVARGQGRSATADRWPAGIEEEEPSLNEVLDAEEEAEEARAIAQDLDALQRLDPGFVTDPVKLYLREIAQAALLTHEQEIALAKRVE
ncbi:MAG TPA: sigma-70 factor domain-containing protein, partial [Thermomicrobiales bacterium]|nr:sigma-70 factor domain-containing protein [Thermomicrobiales bacterium]